MVKTSHYSVKPNLSQFVRYIREMLYRFNSGSIRYLSATILIILLSVSATLAQPADTEPVSVTVEEEYWIPADRSRQQAEDILLKQARQKAVEKVVGVNVQVADVMMTTESDNSFFESYQQLVRNVVNGRIVEEQEPEYFRGEENMLHIRYSCKVAKVSGKSDPGFQLNVASNKNVFTAGEELILEVTPSKDAFITIFSITEDNKVSVLFPNQYMPNNKVEEQTTRIIPNFREREILSFAMQPHPENPQKEYGELLFIVATKSDISYDRLKDRLDYGSNWIELNRWLMEIPRSEWTEAYLQYQVFPG